MPFSFSLERPADIDAVFQNVKAGLEQNGGKMAGDTTRGKISVKQIEGVYEVTENVIKITITKKPLLIPAGLIEQEIRKAFRSV